MATVTVHALDAGHLTLPEKSFVEPNDPSAKRLVPSLSFLIQHFDHASKRTTRIVFDLGIRRELTLYPSALQNHCKTREPITTQPDVVESLGKGGLKPEDIDYVILSHVHWDHIGYPQDFLNNDRTKFIVGPGAGDVLSGKVTLHGSHAVFEPDLLPVDRSIELPPVEPSWGYTPDPKLEQTTLALSRWKPLPPFPAAIDIFGDQSVFIVNAPGHLPGHINLLCRLSNPPSAATTSTSSTNPLSIPDQPKANTETETQATKILKYVLLAADTIHDSHLLTSPNHTIATWSDPSNPNLTQSIHTNLNQAQQTITILKNIMQKQNNTNTIPLLFPSNSPIVQSFPSSLQQSSSSSPEGIGKFMTTHDSYIEIQKGWFGDPRAQEIGRLNPTTNNDNETKEEKEEEERQVLMHAEVEIVFAHDHVWEENAKEKNRFWPGRL